MTDVLLDPNDSGEVTRIDSLGAEPTEDLRHHMNRRDTTGELTQNLGQYARPDAPFGYLRKTFDIDDTVIYMPETIGLAGPQSPPPPLPKPPSKSYDPETAVISLLGAVAGMDGELRPAVYVGRHRHPDDLDLDEGGRYWEMQRPAYERRLSPWWALAGLVVAGLAIWAGLILAGAAVIW